MGDERKTINWTPEMLARMKQAYEKEKAAGRGGKETFTFDGNEFVMDYAKYLIEFLEGKFGGRK